jgi:tryptophan-rich sensory protein
MIFKNRKDAGKLLIALILPQIAGVIGSLFTMPATQTWYMNINKPWFTPPNWLFGPVWITLFVLMGVALWLVWRQPKESPNKNFALFLFAMQLILNTFWSIIFFGWGQFGLAFLEIIVLWIMVFATALVFAKQSKWAGALLIPYILWLTLASALNYQIWTLN